MRYIFLPLVVFMGSTIIAQEKPIPTVKKKELSFGVKQVKGKKPLKLSATRKISIEDYKIISYARDTIYLDTTLTIQKEYKHNYLRKDNFELMDFPNVGQTYTKLGVDFSKLSFYPSIGAKAKHFNYKEKEDIAYYNVATPMSDLFFKTTLEEGHLLDAVLTFNTSEQLNFSLGYKGFRSLGKYQYNQAKSGNFVTTANYESKNKRYSLRMHIAIQNIGGEENGGLANKEEQFETGDPDFSDRKRVDIVFKDAKNKVLGKRYFYEHQYTLVKKRKDSGNIGLTSLVFGHQFNYETKSYQFNQVQKNSYFGNGVFVDEIHDKSMMKTTYNQLNVRLQNKGLGKLKGFVDIYRYNYFFNSILITDKGKIQNQLNGDEIGLGANYKKQIRGFDLDAKVKYMLYSSLKGSMIDISASYRLDGNNKMAIRVHSSARMPNFNYLLYQSDYMNYNWQNIGKFDRQGVNCIQFNVASRLLGNLSAKYTVIDKYTYFASTATTEEIGGNIGNAFVKSFQEQTKLTYIKLKYNKEFRLGNFALDNTVLYQNVSQTNKVLNLPQLVTRNTLYFSKEVYKKAMYLQTGVSIKYFTPYNMDAYNPLLGEFYVQNNKKLGGFYTLDFFINVKVQQTRLYLKAEHFNSSFSGRKYYSAPNYPYRDFVIRFGLVWNFFS